MNYIKIKKNNLLSRFFIFMVLILTIIGIISTLGLNNNFQSVYGWEENNTLSSTDALLKPKPLDNPLFAKDTIQKDNLFKPKPQGNPLNTDDDEFVASGSAYLTIYQI
jgi:hypothetical protein